MHEQSNETNAESSGRPFADGRILVVGLKGWNDAGEAASSAVSMLAQTLGIRHRHEVIDDEEFFDYSINRPHSVRSSSGERRIIWPHVALLGPSDDAADEDDQIADSDVVSAPGEVPLFSLGDDAVRRDGAAHDQAPDAQGASDVSDASDVEGANLAGDAEMRVTAANGDNLLVLFGHEPTLKWRAFTTRVLDLCEELGVTRLVLVGALLADVPHSRPISVFLSSEEAAFREELDIGRSEYQGPTGVLAALSQLAATRGIPSVSMWASVPHYASQPPSPKAELAIIDKLEELLDVNLPRGGLIERAEQWEDEVDAATGEDSEIADYIGYLERAHDMVEAPEASGEAIAKEFERFLRQGEGRLDNGRNSAPGHSSAGWTGPIAKPGAQQPASTSGSPAASGDEDASPEHGDTREDGDIREHDDAEREQRDAGDDVTGEDEPGRDG